MAVVGVELETLVSELDALESTQPSTSVRRGNCDMALLFRCKIC